MEEKQTPEIDITSHLQVLEEGDKFESSLLRLNRCCFLALLRVETHLLQALWNDLSLPLVGLAFQKENAEVVLRQLPHDRMNSAKGRRMGNITEDETGERERDQERKSEREQERARERERWGL